MIRSYLSNLASAYQYVFDQTLHLMNQGYTESEIVQSLALPQSLAPKLVSASVLLLLRRQHPHSIPVLSNCLHPEPGRFKPADGNKRQPSRLVEYLGDVTTVLKRAEEDFAKGDYQWVAQITNILIQADLITSRPATCAQTP